MEIEDGELAETYMLEPGERVVKASGFEARSEVSGRVTIDGEERHRLLWPERSCYRHGIALGSEAIETGWVEPLEGPGDTQHDCYAGVDATKPFDEMADS
ncbi:hypothetical protein [Halalkaliarchaeum sp. AArc-CO]|uniref:hypothetical protein n=1 Tax=Halalkaliarchaeum sp. AArc-CO TaxID=2866381 RepID=UPI00217DA0E1|nr:hypothetical protein [Halalkaliarchaeum sp. AArc-CO]